MKLIDKFIYKNLVNTILSFKNEHAIDPSAIVMNSDTNRTLIEEIKDDKEHPVLLITRLFSIDIIIDEEMYDNSILALNDKEKLDFIKKDKVVKNDNVS